MTERTVTFSAPMVRALLHGRKTQTRRLATSPLRRCQPGDRLIVREHWKTMAMHDAISPTVLGEKWRKSVYPAKERACPVLYLADETRRGVWPEEQRDGWKSGKHRQAMHMPKWASRMSLLITDVRVEPLQAISAADAEAEGVVWDSADGYDVWYVPGANAPHTATPTECYGGLWDMLHAPPLAWADNPDVLVLTFEVHHTPAAEQC